MSIKIDKVDYWIQRVLPQVYDESLSFSELLGKVLAKLNEVVEEVNDYFSEDVEVHIERILQEWYESGKLETIINEALFNGKADKSLVDVLYQYAFHLGSYPREVGEVTDTPRLNRALVDISNNGGGTLLLPKGEYTLSNATIVIPPNTHLVGYGAVLQHTEGHITILKLSSNSSLTGLTLNGFGNTTADYGGNAISIEGTNHLSYLENISLTDITIRNIGGSGVRCHFAKNIHIENITIENVGIYGVLCMSCENVGIERGLIKNITGTSTGLAYGVTFTRLDGSTSYPIATNPRSRNCYVKDMTVENVPTWKGLDTHGGHNIRFLNNVVRNCLMGIGLVPTDDGGTNYESPEFCIVQGNTIYGTNTGEGIVLNGGLNGSSVYSYATNCKVVNNIIHNCGLNGNTISGALKFAASENLLVQNNAIENPRPHGINMYRQNMNFIVEGNVIKNANDNTINSPSGVFVSSTHNKGIISNTGVYQTNSALNTYVGQRGVHIGTSTEEVEVQIGAVWGNTPFNVYGSTNTPNYFLTMQNGAKIFNGFGSPEGVVNGRVGSLYINLNGGAETLYIKQTGMGKTGWVVK